MKVGRNHPAEGRKEISNMVVKAVSQKGGFSTRLFRRLEMINVAGTQATAIAVKEGWRHQGPMSRFSLCWLRDKETLDLR